ncbi:UPF0481 protein At3g47200-like [Rhodamnia argentea]|uniref:UPF0481 protein At3g47200-like n=1 Tax=Rhodamnia argentea TaxID=178133 RepID=A0A8B8NJD1_9MYRT|nr:UPF0481 protein At3g47200-like [Rhodamnia argentea]
MEQRFRERPRLLRQTASNGLCCIFRVPRSVFVSNPKAYEPQIVSIGPYHRGKEQVEMLEQHKPRLFAALLDRTRGHGAPVEAYFRTMASVETKIRECYSEDLDCGSWSLIEMMVLDACFVVEMFRVTASLVPADPADPLFSMPWVYSFLTLDLLLIENQIPFFVLETVFELSMAPTEAHYSLNKLALEFFNYSLPRPQHELERHYHVPNVTHLLDLFRLSLVGHLELEDPGDVNEEFLQLIPSAKQLLLAGIKLKPRKSDRFIDVRFERGVLQIPPLTLDAFTRSLFLNCIAYEQCSCYCSKHITTYAVLMSCVISTAADAALLSEHNIITNFSGSDEYVARYFNNLTRGVSFDISISYLAGLFREVTRYHQNKWHVQWSGIKREYFGSPWSFISAVAAFILLALTVVQAFYAVYAYYRPSK